VFEDGSAAILVNELGRGAVITVPLSLAESSRLMPGLVRDVLDFALARHGLKRPFDIDGIDGDMDAVVASGDGRPAVAVANYGPGPVEIAIAALSLEPGRRYALIDLASGTRTARLGRQLSPWRAKVPGHGFVAFRVIPE